MQWAEYMGKVRLQIHLIFDSHTHSVNPVHSSWNKGHPLVPATRPYFEQCTSLPATWAVSPPTVPFLCTSSCAGVCLSTPYTSPGEGHSLVWALRGGAMPLNRVSFFGLAVLNGVYNLTCFCPKQGYKNRS